MGKPSSTVTFVSAEYHRFPTERSQINEADESYRYWFCFSQSWDSDATDAQACFF